MTYQDRAARSLLDMTFPQQTQAPAQPNANITSAGWTGPGVPQATNAWCFAAAESLVHRAFGVNLGQDELAHNCLLARGRNNDPHGSARAYYAGLRQYYNQFNLNNMSWATIGVYVTADQNLNQMLRAERGQPMLTGRTFTRGNAPDAATIVQTIDAGGLVIIGDNIHWKVVFGYASDAQGNVTSYKVYNPWGAGTTTPNMTPATMSNGIQETYYVTA